MLEIGVKGWPQTGPSVVKVKLLAPTSVSGGSTRSASVIPVGVMAITHNVEDGKSQGGSMRTLAAPLTAAVVATGVPAGHDTVIAPADTLTRSLKSIVTVLPTGTARAPSAGVVAVTVGAASPATQGPRGEAVLLGDGATTAK